MRRLLLAGGVAGPAAFVAAWAVGGVLREGYDPVEQTISRLAEQGARTAPLMTAGFLAFGVLVPAAATRLRPRGLRVAATASGLATLAVAATPLGHGLDGWHYVAAGTGYLAQAAVPVAGAAALPRPAVSRAVGAACAASLVASLVDPRRAGLWQRLGLGLVDAWLAVVSVHALREDPRA